MHIVVAFSVSFFLMAFSSGLIIFIMNRRNRNASDWSLKAAAKANKELQLKLKPHFLQRMKNAEFKDYLPVKKELVVWSHLTDIQREVRDCAFRCILCEKTYWN